MKIDNFTTAKCRACGWVKQFSPGKEYNTEDFRCKCKTIDIITPSENIESFDDLKIKAKQLGISFHPSISESKLIKKIDEVQRGA